VHGVVRLEGETKRCEDMMECLNQLPLLIYPSPNPAGAGYHTGSGVSSGLNRNGIQCLAIVFGYNNNKFSMKISEFQ
jgi:hypothetical protein